MDRGTRRSESSQTGIKVLTLLVTLALISVQLYRALTAGAVGDTTSLRNFTIALILLGGIGVYYSSYWQPVVFLVGAIFVGTLTVFWGLRAPVTVTLETSRLVLGGSLFILCIYQFLRNQLQTPPAQGQSNPNGT